MYCLFTPTTDIFLQGGHDPLRITNTKGEMNIPSAIPTNTNLKMCLKHNPDEYLTHLGKRNPSIG